MYRAVGEEPLIFLPGSLTPRPPERKPLVVLKQPPVLVEPTKPRLALKPPPVLKAPTTTPEASPVPVLLPEDIPQEPLSEEKSMLPYIIIGGVVLVGAAVFFMRK